MPNLRLSALAVFAAALAATASAQTIQVNKENRTIAVTSTDKVTVLADTANVHIGFIAYGPDSDGAYANGSRTSNAIMKALTAAGIPKETIESENQNLAPVQNYQLEKLTPAEKAQRQFVVNQSWTVRTPTDNASKVLDTAVKPRANQSYRLQRIFENQHTPESAHAPKALTP